MLAAKEDGPVQVNVYGAMPPVIVGVRIPLAESVPLPTGQLTAPGLIDTVTLEGCVRTIVLVSVQPNISVAVRV